MTNDDTVNMIQRQYGQTAQSGLSGKALSVRAVAEAFGYTTEELLQIPAESNMALSCGNPLATEHLRPGETVVDLGSGGGLDVFLAAKKVGPTGRAIGIDMTPEMVSLASRNAARGGADGQPYKNAEFYLGRIDAIPLPDACADLIISNCVINLAPDKSAVFREMVRVLKPGGRVAVSDIALKQTLPQELAESAAALVGCIAGAISIAEYEQGLTQAGFANVTVIDTGADLNAYALVEGQAACCAPTPLEVVTIGSSSANTCCSPGAAQNSSIHDQLRSIMQRYDVNAYAAAVKVLATKPGVP